MVAGLLLSAFVAGDAAAQQAQTIPSIAIDSAPMVSPADAMASGAPFASFTTASAAVRSDRVKALARAFKPDMTGVDEVHSYLRSSIEIVPQFGLKQGASGVALNRKGTAIDVAMTMVELVRQLGLTAHYRIGVITLTPAQVAGWMGTNDARLACQMFRDGGFPATVNGETDCTAVSGQVTSATALHVWVEVQDPTSHTWYAFDPSIRTAAATTATPLSSLMTLDVASIANAGGAPSGGTAGDPDEAANPDEATIRAKLLAASNTLKTSLTSEAYAQVSTKALLGQPEPDTVYIHQQRLTSLTGYQPLATAYDEIPMELRTRLEVTVAFPANGGPAPTPLIDWLGDATGIGEDGLLTLDLQTTNSIVETSDLEELRAFDGTLLASDPTVNVANLSGHTQTVTIRVDHPYAAGGGVLHDRTIIRNVDLSTPIALSIGLGAGSFEAVSELERHQVSDVVRNWNIYSFEDGTKQQASWQTQWLNCFLGSPVKGGFVSIDVDPPEDDGHGGQYQTIVRSITEAPIGMDPYAQCLQQAFQSDMDTDIESTTTLVAMRRPEMARYHKRWNASIGSLSGIYANAAGGRAQIHHAIGFLRINRRISQSQSFFDESLVPDIEVESSFQGVESAKPAFIGGLSVALSTLEGAIAQQATDGPASGASAAIYAGYARSADANRVLHRINAGNANAEIAELQNPSGLVSALAPTWTLFVPTRGGTGPLQYTVQPQPGTTAAQTAPTGQGSLLIGYSVTGSRYSVAPLDYLDGVGFVKGAASAIPDWQSTKPTTTEAFTAQKDTAAKFGTVSLETGELSAVETPLTIGGKEEPFGLSLGLTYGSYDTKGNHPLGWGWQHSQDIQASIVSDLQNSIGDGSPRAALATLTTAQATVALLSQNGLNAQTMSAALLAQNWWGESLYDNAVAVEQAGVGGTFIRQPDGTYLSPWGSHSQLALAGGPATCQVQGSINMLPAGFKPQDGYEYLETFLDYNGSCPAYGNTIKAGAGPISITLTDGDDGSIETFSFTRPSQEFGSVDLVTAPQVFPDGINDLTIGNYRGKTIAAWPIAQRSWPDGRNVSYAYDSATGVLSSVTTSTGFSLSFNYGPSVPFVDPDAGPGNGITIPEKRRYLQSVTDNAGRSVQFRADSGALTSLTDPRGKVTVFGWTGVGHSSQIWGEYPQGRSLLSSDTLPSQSAPLVQFTYDNLDHVQQATWVSGSIFNYAEEGGAGSVFLPDGGRQLQVLDLYGHAGWSRDDGAMALTKTQGNVFGAALTTALYDATTMSDVAGIAYSRSAEAYDALGRTTSKSTLPRTNPATGAFFIDAPLTTTYAYADSKWVFAATTVTDPMLNQEVTQYDQTFGKPIRTAKPLGALDEVDYGTSGDSVGLPIQYRKTISLGVAIATNFAWTSRGELASATQDAGDASHLNLTTAFGYDAVGNVSSVDGPRTDVNDLSNYLWNEDRQLTFAFDPAPYDRVLNPTGSQLRAAVRIQYSDDGEITQADKASVSDTNLDSNGFPTNFTALLTTTYAYDTSRRRVQVTAPTTLTQYSYDPMNRLSCSAVRMNASAYGSLPSDACTLGPSIMQPGAIIDDRISRTTYDLAGRPITQTRALGTPLQQDYQTVAYQPDGKPQWMEDAVHNRTSYDYDSFERLSRQHFPVTDLAAHASSATDVEVYGYDADGNRISLTKRDGRTIQFQFDALNRETVEHIVDGSSPDVYTDYDSASRKKYAHFGSAAGSGVDYTYDNVDRVLTEATSGLTVTYVYGDKINRTQVSWPDGLSSNYTYDGLGRVVDIRDNGGGSLAHYAYDDIGRTTTITRGNATSTSFVYTADQLATLGQNIWGGAPSVQFGFSRNQAAQITGRTVSNPLYETISLANQHQSNTVYDGLNRNLNLATVGAPCAASGAGYDCNGNLTNDGARTFGYDIENRLVSVSGPASVRLSYDPLGRLQKSTTNGVTTGFLYSGNRLVAEYSGSNLQRRYVFGPGDDTPLVWYEGAQVTIPRYYYADNQGSIVAWSDGLGNGEIYAYDPYGNPSGWSGGARFRYTGQIAIPEAQLFHYKGRAYDPASGRFLQTDPAGYTADFDLYSYTGGDPINREDPTGLCWLCVSERTHDVNGRIVIKSNQLLRLLVPGQVQWDQVRSDVANQSYGEAAFHTVGIFANVGATVFTLGASSTARVEATAASGAAAASNTGHAEATAASGAAAAPNRIYSSRVLVRAANEPGPFHNFPESFDAEIFQGKREVVKPDYVLYTRPGTLNGVPGTYEIGVKPSPTGRTEIITHRFFRPDRP